jgi:aspartyl-tRNA(Asn)/glutamyl-tRNA(Gln) amidotransferase subunit A
VAVPAYLTIAEASAAIRARRLSPVELTRSRLERIAALDGRLSAFVTVTAEPALAQARAAEQELARGEWRGPLHGVPLALKDLYATAGVRTTGHSRVLADWVPDEDAAGVARLKEAGAVLLGKLAMSEWATGSVVEGPWPPARNPWNVEHVPGGSSSGSGAAVAAGLCLGALGSDTGGSIRGPAAHCGVVGIRPTYGRVSRRGVLPLCWSLDTAGPLAPSARDCALLLAAIAGHDPGDPGSADVPVPDYAAALGGGLAGARVGIDRRHFFHAGINRETLAAVEAALGVLGGLGARIEEVEMPSLDDAPAALHAIHACEAHAYHAERLARAPELYGPTARNYFRVGALVSAADYLRAQRLRERIRQEVLAVLRRVDLLAAPTQAGPAERFDAIAPGPDRFARASPMQPFSLAGVPAVSVPCGFSSAGLPIGLQLVGRPFDEATVLAAADAYESATPWHAMHPPLEPEPPG